MHLDISSTVTIEEEFAHFLLSHVLVRASSHINIFPIESTPPFENSLSASMFLFLKMELERQP